MESIKIIWDFFQKEILGMHWLNRLLGDMLNGVGLDVRERIGGSLQFFLYDTVKIFFLLCLLIFLISYIQSYFPPERTKRILGRFQGVTANILAALLGTVTPFCSCSSIPLFIGFTRAKLPLGVTFSFLISSPMVDLGSLVLLMSIFGLRIALAYVVWGLGMALIGGTVIAKMRFEEYVEDFVRNGSSADGMERELHFGDRVRYARGQVAFIVKKVAPYILIGVGIGAFIHNWIPENIIVGLLGDDNPFGVILATLAGVPIYADIFGAIPIAEALLAKGAQLGVVLSFLMGVTTLSLPSLVMLRKAVKPELLGIFIGICVVGIILIGYFFNAIHFLLKRREDSMFFFGKKNTAVDNSANNSAGSGNELAQGGNVTVSSIKVLGAGCSSCHTQFENAKQAVQNMGLAVEVDYVTDLQKIMEYGVLSTPALVIDENVAAMGNILSPADIEELLQK